jgi:hypothetical protein
MFLLLQILQRNSGRIQIPKTATEKLVCFKALWLRYQVREDQDFCPNCLYTAQ